ncbi:peptidoglycan DD-metalloendopeptidase family protein [Novosphingobium sp.]|uniref:murein hydrolase activator EnvC family protein n=1 Tax=Novosphingobium sp. TaxID=1874826 RepID=UPI00286B04A8|nr:peptidoglycan DD-metalloendopeptidase family protein [Novosphingobium sp.]
MKRAWLIPLVSLLAVAGWQGLDAQGAVAPIETAEDAQTALVRAQRQGAEARTRAEALEADASRATAAAEKTRQEEAALAARVQEAEAQIAANAAQIRLIGAQQADLARDMAARQRPLIELTAALQRLSRRPPLLSLLRPGSLQDTVYLRAVLETILPEVARRTAGLRAAIDKSRALQKKAEDANAALRANQAELVRRRDQLARLEAGQLIVSREASGAAQREADRALALREDARDLTALVGELGKAGSVREALAALPGPVLRPAQPGLAQTPTDPPPAGIATPGAPRRYILPVAGRLVAGFGASQPGRAQSRGLTLLAGSQAQVVAPGSGRVAFAGTFQGYGQVVIIEHGGGWVSLVTGLVALDCRVGQELVAGSPLGRLGTGSPAVTLELRRAGEPVNPLDFLRN